MAYQRSRMSWRGVTRLFQAKDRIKESLSFFIFGTYMYQFTRQKSWRPFDVVARSRQKVFKVEPEMEFWDYRGEIFFERWCSLLFIREVLLILIEGSDHIVVGLSYPIGFRNTIVVVFINTDGLVSLSSVWNHRYTGQLNFDQRFFRVPLIVLGYLPPFLERWSACWGRTSNNNPPSWRVDKLCCYTKKSCDILFFYAYCTPESALESVLPLRSTSL